ncbi:MAG TPA: GNAT family N-acetyltransferase [Caldilineaceae bacterium]|nr:GNAT family N-acetyltransferase [Caldilineaceae bacterium]
MRALRIQYPIATARLQLTPFTAGDGDALYALESDPVVKRFGGGTLNRVQSDQLLQRFITQVVESGFGAVAIKQKATTQIIGLCGLYREEHEAELFFGLARQAWGQGFATEACQGLIAAAFQQTALQRIIANVDRQNPRSSRVLERLGLRQCTSDDSSSLLIYELTR